MDTVKFEIVLSRSLHPNSTLPSPVPSLPRDASPTGVASPVPDHHAERSSGCSANSTDLFLGKSPQAMKQASLGDRFHDWMEFDLEHGL